MKDTPDRRMDVMRNAIWTVGRKWMLGTALVAGLLGTGVANAAPPREFRGQGGHEYGRESGREHGREYVRGYDRGFYRGGYERPGFGVVVAAPYAEGYGNDYIPPSPGDGYVWLNGAWVFRDGYRGYAYGRGYGGVARFDRGRDFRGEGFRGGYDRGFRGRR
jgi:hypothetical protein